MEWMDWGLYFYLYAVYLTAIFVPSAVCIGVMWFREKRKKESEKMTEEEKWLVNDKYCKGCKYYSTLSGSHTSGDKCCDYTYITGKIRKNPPKSCEVKEKGKRPRAYSGTEWLREKRVKNRG